MRGKRIRWAAAGAIAATVVIGGSAVAGARLAGDGGTVIRACAQKENGQLRLSSDGTCRPSENAVSWNEQGPPGPSGAASLDALDRTPCTLGGRTGVTYLMKGNGLTNFNIYLSCLMPDGAEPNDGRDAAATLSMPASYVMGTVYPAGDEDWYSIPGQVLSSFAIYSQPGIAPADATYTADLYRDGALFKTAHQNADGTWTTSYNRYSENPSDTAVHDWLVHVTSSAVQLYMIVGN